MVERQPVAAPQQRVDLEPARGGRVGPGPGLDLRQTGPPPVERSLATFVTAARAGDPGAVCCTVADGVGTLAVALAAQDDAAQRAAGGGRAD